MFVREGVGGRERESEREIDREREREIERERERERVCVCRVEKGRRTHNPVCSHMYTFPNQHYFPQPPFLGAQVWLFYRLDNYNGDLVVLTEGTYDDPETQFGSVGVDDISSVRVRGNESF